MIQIPINLLVIIGIIVYFPLIIQWIIQKKNKNKKCKTHIWDALVTHKDQNSEWVETVYCINCLTIKDIEKVEK